MMVERGGRINGRLLRPPRPFLHGGQQVVRCDFLQVGVGRLQTSMLELLVDEPREAQERWLFAEPRNAATLMAPTLGTTMAAHHVGDRVSKPSVLCPEFVEGVHQRSIVST
jgi:hypothetical protein